ncbi:MAG: hypothetical protein ACFE0R_14115 [Salinarimonas sp.]
MSQSPVPTPFDSHPTRGWRLTGVRQSHEAPHALSLDDIDPAFRLVDAREGVVSLGAEQDRALSDDGLVTAMRAIVAAGGYDSDHAGGDLCPGFRIWLREAAATRGCSALAWGFAHDLGSGIEQFEEPVFAADAAPAPPACVRAATNRANVFLEVIGCDPRKGAQEVAAWIADPRAAAALARCAWPFAHRREALAVALAAALDQAIDASGRSLVARAIARLTVAEDWRRFAWPHLLGRSEPRGARA